MNIKIDLETKKPLWIALSHLFLDTEICDTDLDHIVKIIKESKLPIKEVEEILLNEVFPVCIPNMKVVAGEWAGFNEEWLIASIQKLKKPNKLQRLLYKKDFWLIKEEWQKITKKYE